MALPSFTAAGAAAAAAQGTGGNVTPALPSSPQDNDLLLCFVVSRDNSTHSLSSGWTQKFQASNGASTQISVWYARYKGTSPNSANNEINAAPTVTHSGTGAIVSRITGWRNVVTYAQANDPFDVFSSSISATGTSISTAAVTTAHDNALVLHFMGAGTANTANAFSSLGGACTTSVYTSNTASNSGGRACSGIYYNSTAQATAGSTGSSSATASASPTTATGWAGLLGALRYAGTTYNDSRTEAATAADSLATDATKSFYLRNATAWGTSAASGLAQDGGLATSAAAMTTGWTVGTNATGKMALLNYGSEVSAATFAASTLPSGAPSTNAPDCFRSTNPLNGTFADSWQFAIGVKSTTAGASGSGRLRIRVWRSTSPTGASATEITASTIVTSSWSNLLTSAQQNLTATWTPGSFSLSNEYLFFQIACEVVTASGSASADVLLQANPTNSLITSGRWTLAGTALRDNAVDSGFTPPNAKTPYWGFDETTAAMVADRNPGKAGDLCGLIISTDNTTANSVWYLVVSQDLGATWTWLTASNAEPNQQANPIPQSAAIVQDTSNYDLHHVWQHYSTATLLYNRVTLSYDGNGHITGWSWAAQNKTGPSFNATATSPPARVDICEVIDANSVHRLLLSWVDQTSTTTIVGRLHAAVTTPAIALAPTGAASWCKITDSTATSADDILGAWSLTTATDANAMVNFTSLTSYVVDTHSSQHSVAQIAAAGGDLAFIYGGFFYNDQAHSPGKLWRWRFTNASGSNWTVDNAAKGVVVETDNGTSGPCVGHLVGTANKIWLGYVSPGTGIKINSYNTSGTETTNAISSPDANTSKLGYVAFGIDSSETKCWAMWTLSTGFGGLLYERSGYYDGSAWLVYDDSWVWNQNGWSQTSGAVPWRRIRDMPKGIGVLAYGYDTYSSGAWKYHAHVLSLAAGGTTYNDTTSESSTAADSLASAATWPNTQAEAATAAASLSNAATWPNTQSEASSAAESLNPAGSTFGVPVSETNTGADALSVGQVMPATQSEAATAADAPVEAQTFANALSEASSAADSNASGATWASSQSEAGSASDSLAPNLSIPATVSESNTAAESLAYLSVFGLAVTEANTAAESFATAATWPNALSEAATAAETPNPAGSTFNEAPAETSTATESLSVGNLLALALSESNTAADALANAVAWGPALSEAASGADALANAITWGPGVVTEASAAADALSDSSSHSGTAYSDSIQEVGNASDSLSPGAVYANTQSEASSAAESPAPNLSIPKTQGEAAAAAESLSVGNVIASTVSESNTASDSASAAAVWRPTLSEASASADALANVVTWGPTVTEAGTASAAYADELLPVGGNHFSDSISEASSAGSSLSTAVVWNIDPTDTQEELFADDLVDPPNLVIGKTLTEASTAADALSPGLRIPASQTEAATAAESYTTLGAFVSLYTEAASALDSPVGLTVYPVTISDGASAADSLSGGTSIPFSISEASSGATALSVVVGWGPTVAEAASALEQLAAAATLPNALAAAVSASDAVGILQTDDQLTGITATQALTGIVVRKQALGIVVNTRS